MVGEPAGVGGAAARRARSADHGFPLLRKTTRCRHCRGRGREAQGSGTEHLHWRDDRLVRVEGCDCADALGRCLPEFLGSVSRLVRRDHPRRRHRTDGLLAARLPLPLPGTPQSRQVKLEVVTIGTELVLGQIIDTNAAELGRALAAAGVEVVRHISVADRPEAIRAAVAEALERTGFVLTTGGLGPTRDDMTKTVVAELFGKRLVVDDALLAGIEARFQRLGRPMPAINRTQAQLPEGATILP